MPKAPQASVLRPEKLLIQGLGNGITCIFHKTFSVNK